MAGENLPALVSDIKNAASEVRNAGVSYASVLHDDITGMSRDFYDITYYRAASVESKLLPYAGLLAFDAQARILRFYFGHNSPSVAGLIAAIIKIGKWIWDILSTLLQIVGVLKDLGIIDLLYKYWPDFKSLVDQLRTFAGQLSDAIGWGFDGLLHIMNAANTVTGFAAGLLHKDFGLMDIEAYSKVHNITLSAALYIDEIQENPGQWLFDQIDSLKGANYVDFNGYRNKIDVRLNDAFKFIDWSLDQGSQALDELIAIRQGMPSYVSKYIPQSIWDGLAKADRVINEDIIPTVKKIKDAVATVEKYLDQHADRLNELAGRLALPGTLLTGVDDLDEQGKLIQEALIDDIASRELGRGVDSDIAGYAADLESFAAIDSAISQHSNEPGFMTLESLSRKKATGIIEEPRETWFVGDF